MNTDQFIFDLKVGKLRTRLIRIFPCRKLEQIRIIDMHLHTDNLICEFSGKMLINNSEFF